MNTHYVSKRPDYQSFFVVSGHLILVFIPTYLGAMLPFGYHTFLFWLIFGLSMNGILNLMHEACHYHVFKSKKYSEFLGKYIIAPLVFADFEKYRERHWDHHRFLGVEGETKDAYLINITGKNIFLLLLRCLFMIEAVMKFTKQVPGKNKSVKGGYQWLGIVLIVQAIYFSSLVLAAHFFTLTWTEALVRASIVYFFVYMYGLMSLTVFMADLRAIAEHQIFDEHDLTQGYASLRNFRCNIISRYLMGAYGFGEHYTHHKVPSIPYYNLKHATQEFLQEDPSYKSNTGYFMILGKIIKGK